MRVLIKNYNYDLPIRKTFRPKILSFKRNIIFSGFFLNNAKIFEPMTDYELFDDAHFWTLPDESPKRDLNETTAVEMTMLENDK